VTAQFRDTFYPLVPPWLRTDNGERYMYTLELCRDLLMEKANQAIKIRLPGQGDVSQVPFLAYDRQLLQGPLESTASFILRLQGAFSTWEDAGSAIAVLGQLQAYAQGYQSVTLPQFAIVSNIRVVVGPHAINSWWTLNYDDPIGTEPLLTTVPANWNWDERGDVWRSWLVVYQYTDPPVLSGSSGAASSAGGGSFILADIGENVNGVWVPKTSGTPLNAPFITITGLSGLLPEHVGGVITLTDQADNTNTGRFQITDVPSSSSVVIANLPGLDPMAWAGPLTWDVALYPWMPPAYAWGTTGLVWGQGEGTPPPLDTGSNVGGVWQPTTRVSAGESPSWCWGVRVDPLEIVTLRGLLQTWKSAGTYYPNIIICYDGQDNAYQRTVDTWIDRTNPDGSFGELGQNVDGVWVPTRLIVSTWDCFVQGTGRAVACSVENLT